MRSIEAILMKFAMVFAVLFVILGIVYGIELMDIFLISLVVTIVGFIGDLVIYPKTSNKVATAGDWVLAFLLVWLLGMVWIEILESSLIMPAIFSAIIIAIGEWFFHIYLTKRLWEHKETSHTTTHDEPRQS
ncbi:DUF2512 family protein [Planococcus ruber]|uniref:DUF2512 family protein n=1 Tax=Planococcus ruber TaxID=2027871 RepID=UPI001FEDEB67|nr:DUF2512 family protein [Planococcus ruber]MCJ1907937.1 YndM family protein [Planococcus ruber]